MCLFKIHLIIFAFPESYGGTESYVRFGLNLTRSYVGPY